MAKEMPSVAKAKARIAKAQWKSEMGSGFRHLARPCWRAKSESPAKMKMAAMKDQMKDQKNRSPPLAACLRPWVAVSLGHSTPRDILTPARLRVKGHPVRPVRLFVDDRMGLAIIGE